MIFQKIIPVHTLWRKAPTATPTTQDLSFTKGNHDSLTSLPFFLRHIFQAFVLFLKYYLAEEQMSSDIRKARRQVSFVVMGFPERRFPFNTPVIGLTIYLRHQLRVVSSSKHGIVMIHTN